MHKENETKNFYIFSWFILAFLFSLSHKKKVIARFNKKSKIER